VMNRVGCVWMSCDEQGGLCVDELWWTGWAVCGIMYKLWSWWAEIT